MSVARSAHHDNLEAGTSSRDAQDDDRAGELRDRGRGQAGPGAEVRLSRFSASMLVLAVFQGINTFFPKTVKPSGVQPVTAFRRRRCAS